MHPITVLLNPRSGGRAAGAVEQITAAFRDAGAAADVRVTEGSDMTAAAASAAARAPTVVAAGGDGTASAVAAALVGTEAALGVIPLGTLNHFSKDLGIPLDVRLAARVIAERRTTEIDLGDVNGRVFINNASVGMYASVVAERTAMQRLGRGKWIAHGLAAIRVWRRYQRLRTVLHVDGARRAVRTPFVFVGNNEYQLSGLDLGGRKVLADARLHVCMAPGMSRRGVARMIATAIFGDVGRLQGFESFTASALMLDAAVARLPASIDGEVVMLDNPLTFRIRPRALRVIVP